MWTTSGPGYKVDRTARRTRSKIDQLVKTSRQRVFMSSLPDCELLGVEETTDTGDKTIYELNVVVEVVAPFKNIFFRLSGLNVCRFVPKSLKTGFRKCFLIIPFCWILWEIILILIC